MANTKTVYVVTTNEGTEEFNTVGSVAKYMGIKKLTRKSIEAGQYPTITLREEPVEPKSDVELELELEQEEARLEQLAEEQAFLDKDEEQALTNTEEDDTPLTNEDTDTEESSEEDVEDDTKGDLQLDDANNITENEYPEVGDFADEKAMKKYIKKLSDQSLQEWCVLEGATWKPNDHESINRMRMAMAIKALHFPDTAPKKSKKSKSKYADYTTEQLVQMALDADVEVPDDKGDMRICRMYTIMALKKAGLLS